MSLVDEIGLFKIVQVPYTVEGDGYAFDESKKTKRFLFNFRRDDYLVSRIGKPSKHNPSIDAIFKLGYEKKRTTYILFAQPLSHTDTIEIDDAYKSYFYDP